MNKIFHHLSTPTDNDIMSESFQCIPKNGQKVYFSTKNNDWVKDLENNTFQKPIGINTEKNTFNLQLQTYLILTKNYQMLILCLSYSIATVQKPVNICSIKFSTQRQKK